MGPAKVVYGNLPIDSTWLLHGIKSTPAVNRCALALALILFFQSHQPDPIPAFRKLTSGKVVPHIFDAETCVCQNYADGFLGVIMKPIPVHLNLLATNQDVESHSGRFDGFRASDWLA